MSRQRDDVDTELDQLIEGDDGPSDDDANGHDGATWGAAFFGWLVAAALTVLVATIMVAVGAMVGAETLSDWSAGRPERTTQRGTLAGLITLSIAVFAGGYVVRNSTSYGIRSVCGQLACGRGSRVPTSGMKLRKGVAMPQKSLGDKLERGYEQVKSGLKDLGERVETVGSRAGGAAASGARAGAYRLPATEDTDDRPSTRRTGGSSSATKTKEQLYADAKRLGVKGRSKMTKAELAKAIGRR
jgi:hypothetical protein